jgi:hypothetical protein
MSSGTISLPLGGGSSGGGSATSANQAIEITALQAIQANQTNGTQVTTVSGSIPLPTGASTSALQTTGNTSLSTIATNSGTQATAANQTNGTQVTQISGTVPLPTGASTSALQTTGNTSLATIATNTTGSATAANQATEITHLTSIDTKTPALGAAVTASSTPVTIASDQIVPIVADDILSSGSITTQNLNPNSGTATAGGVVAISPLNGQGIVNVYVSGTYTGALTLQGMVDGTNWVNISYGLSISGTPGTIAAITSAAVGMFQCNIAGLSSFRLSANGAFTGTANITVRASASTQPVLSQVSLSGGISNIGNIGFIPVATSADVVSAAITTTTTSTNLTPALGSVYNINIAVTAVSGTNPTLSVAVQESSDSGSNWFTVYTFPTITAIGSYNSPYLVQRGRILRYVQTITGTTPSFTRSISRDQSSQSNTPPYINFLDFAIVPSTTNSTTASVFVENTNTYTAIVNQGAGGSGVTFALDGSDDNVNWVQSIATVVGVVGGATPQMMSYSGAAFRFIRARVVTGVASTTISYISLIGSIGASSNVTVKPTAGTLIDRSGTTSGSINTSTQLAPANPNRKYLLIQNTGANTIWVNFTSAATASQPSIQLLMGGSFVQESSFVSQEVVNVLSATASSAFTAKEA